MLGISDESMRMMKDVFWPEQMKLYFEHIVRIIPVSIGSFGSEEILRDIEENTRKRGGLEVSEEDLVKAILDSSPYFYRNDLRKLLHGLGIQENKSQKQDIEAIERLLKDIKRASDIAEVSFNEKIVRKIIKVYRKEFLNPDAKISFATTTRKLEHRQLEVYCYFPFKSDNLIKEAVKEQLVTKGENPADKLLDDFIRTCPIGGYCLNFSVFSGVRYVTLIFDSASLPHVDSVFALQHIPESLKNSNSFLNHYNALLISGVCIDFLHKTIALYFRTNQIGKNIPELLLNMLKELDFELPRAELVDLCIKAEILKVTYNYSAPRIQKITFALKSRVQEDMPKNLNTKIEYFIRNVPFRSQNKKFLYAITFTKKGQYMKIGNTYSGIF